MNAQGVYWPRPIDVVSDGSGSPVEVAGVKVEALREQWLVEDRWWTPKPLRRAYFELVLADGRNLVVFREPADSGSWFEQRA
ncbi:MAG: hypothetical protein ACJ75R_09500 [Solirubrobacterales bacterium]